MGIFLSVPTIDKNTNAGTYDAEVSAENNQKSALLLAKKEEDKEEIVFSTDFIFADKTINLTAKSKEDLIDKIEKTKENQLFILICTNNRTLRI